MRGYISILFAVGLGVSGLSQAQGLPACPTIPLTTSASPIVVGDGSATSCHQVALQNALAAGGHITFNCGGAATITLSSELSVTADTVLDGGGLITLDGARQTRLIHKHEGANLTVQNMAFRNGLAPGPNGHFSNECGGAILARGQGTSLAVINSTFENNSVTSINTNDIAGGAIYAFGLFEAVIVNSTFTGNTASNGGAIGVLASGIRIFNSTFANNSALGQRASGPLRGHGGALNMDGVTNSQNPDSNKILHICGSTFNGNIAENQGGATNSVFSDNRGSRTIVEQSTFINNRTTNTESGQGGAIFHMEDERSGGVNEDNFDILNSTFSSNSTYRQGGAVWTLIEGRIRIENSTFEGNRVEDQALGMGGGIAINLGQVNITNSTFANNYAWFHGAGIQAAGDPTITLTNSLFLNNSSERIWAVYHMNRPADVDGGGNLQFPNVRFNQDGMPDDIPVTPTAIIADPQLNMLADNGGPTLTMALSANSPARDAGNVGACPVIDQRGMPRSNCDIGAFELVDNGTSAGFEAMAQASGPANQASLSINVRVASDDIGQMGNIYIAAQVGPQWFFRSGDAWLPWQGGALPIAISGALQDITIPIYAGLNVSSLVGTVIYVGYGRDEADMLANSRVSVVHTIGQ
ncbi:MAG: choice-of-anchor Q domain-containing protein [Pseudomonadota bacterium]